MWAHVLLVAPNRPPGLCASLLEQTYIIFWPPNRNVPPAQLTLREGTSVWQYGLL